VTAPVERPRNAPGAPGATHEEAPHGVFFWICLILGWAVIVFALHGLIADANQTNPGALFRILVGLNIVNDALVAPLLVAVAFLGRRVVPRWAVVPLDIGLITSAVVLLYAYPLLGDWGRTARAGYSRLPWDYAQNVGVVLGAIWFVCALMALWSWRRSRSTPG
jgi:hypothetical protein